MVGAGKVQWFHVLIAGIFIGAIAISWLAGSRRAVIWSGVLFADWMVCEVYLAVPKPTLIDIPWDGTVFVGPWAPQSLLAVVVDASVAAFMLGHRREKARWQFLAFLAVMMMVSLDLIQAMASLFGVPPALPQKVYGIALEALNGVALLFIIGGAIAGAIGNGWRNYISAKNRTIFSMDSIFYLGMVVGEFLQKPWEPSKRWEKG